MKILDCLLFLLPTEIDFIFQLLSCLSLFRQNLTWHVFLGKEKTLIFADIIFIPIEQSMENYGKLPRINAFVRKRYFCMLRNFKTFFDIFIRRLELFWRKKTIICTVRWPWNFTKVVFLDKFGNNWLSDLKFSWNHSSQNIPPAFRSGNIKSKWKLTKFSDGIYQKNFLKCGTSKKRIFQWKPFW